MSTCLTETTPKTPAWFKSSAIYQINPRTFCDEGTIKAVISELPALKELGFKIIYLCPVFEEDDSDDKSFWSTRQKKSGTENPKNPYRMNDYFKIDSEYGTMDDLQELVERAHELELKVLLDLVYFHIGPNALILKAHPEFVMTDENGKIVLGKWQFPIFNYDNLGTREYLWSNMLFYIGAIGVDGFRCDVGDLVPLDFWKEGARRMKSIKPDAVLLNEGRKVEYLSVFNANYGFRWHEFLYSLLHKETSAMEYIDKPHGFPTNGLLLRDMDNHDTVTDWPYRIEEHFGHDCMELILAINYTLDGVPMVYCGNELADTTRHSMFANRFHRGIYEVTNRKAIGKHVNRRKEIIKTLNGFKKDLTVLRDGKTEWINTNHPQGLAFRRICTTETITFAGIFSESEVTIPIDSGEILLANHAVIKDNQAILSEYGYVIVRCRK